MNRKSIVVWIIIILSLCLGILIGFYFYIQNKPNETGIDNTNRNVSFFGSSTPQNRTAVNQPTSTPTTTPAEQAVLIPSAKWRVIWDRPTSFANFTYSEVKATSSNITASSSPNTKERITTKIITVENIRLLDRETGNIFQTSTSTTNVARVSNTTYPRVEQGSFVGKFGTELFLQRLTTIGETIESSYGVLQLLTTTSTSQTLVVKAIQDNILFSSPSPDKTRIAHITSNPNERLIVTKNDGSGKIVLWTSTLKEFIPYWVSKDIIILQSKASATSPTYVYSINATTKAAKKLLVGRNTYLGLTATIRPDLKKAVISYLDSKGIIKTAIRSLDSSDETTLYISTLAEKCIWSKKNIDIIFCASPEVTPQGAYPDIWYQGVKSFEDNIWKINTKTGETRLIFRPLDYFLNGLDIQKLELNQSENYLIFQNRVDLTIWGLQVEVESATSTKR